MKPGTKVEVHDIDMVALMKTPKSNISFEEFEKTAPRKWQSGYTFFEKKGNTIVVEQSDEDGIGFQGDLYTFDISQVRAV